MSEKQPRGGTAIWLDQEAVEQVDEMAEQLSELVNVKITRTAVVRRALSELYDRLKGTATDDHE